jgi:hypothetical protein
LIAAASDRAAVTVAATDRKRWRPAMAGQRAGITELR